MVSKIGLVIFFLVFGLNVFFPFAIALTVLGIDAIITAIAIALSK